MFLKKNNIRGHDGVEFHTIDLYLQYSEEEVHQQGHPYQPEHYLHFLMLKAM